MQDQTLTSHLHRSVRERKQVISETIVKGLRSSHAEHYKSTEGGLLKKRIEMLVDAFERSLSGDPNPFVNHIRNIARERIGEGVALEEIQLVLSLLEQQAWFLVIEQGHSDFVKQLAIVTTVIGTAKDHLARVYLEVLRTAELRVEALQKKVDELFKGTDRADWVE